jgi:hypothetical protein
MRPVAETGAPIAAIGKDPERLSMTAESRHRSEFARMGIPSLTHAAGGGIDDIHFEGFHRLD